MSRISLSAYKQNKAATASAPAPERRLGFGESVSTRETRAQESQLEAKLLGRLEESLKQCASDPASAQAIKDWFCTEGVKGHAKKGIIRVLVYVRVWSAVLRGEGVDVAGQDIDNAENMARQAFGACICAVTAINGVVYKLAAGAERKEQPNPQSEVLKTITSVLPSIVEVMAGRSEKTRPRGFHPNELAKLQKMLASWRKRGVLPQPALDDLGQLLTGLEYSPGSAKENGGAGANDVASPAIIRHKKHTAWVLQKVKKADGATGGRGPSPPRSVSRAGSPPGPGTELERQANMKSALQELYANHAKPEEWWGTAFEGKGVFRNGPEGHWSLHLRRAREEAHQRRKEGRGLLGVRRHGDRLQDEIERAVAAGDRKVASKHERRIPRHGRDGGRNAKPRNAKEVGREEASAPSVKSEAAAEDSDALMEVDEESSDSGSDPSTPSTVPSEASPSPEPERASSPVAAESVTNARAKSEDEEEKKADSGYKSESATQRQEKGEHALDSAVGKEPPSPPRILSRKEQEEAERQRRREELRRAGKERGKLREAEKLRQRKEKEQARERMMAEMKRKKAEEKAQSDQMLKEAREKAAELQEQEDRERKLQSVSARETEEVKRRTRENGRESERPRDGGRRDKEKSREERARSGKDAPSDTRDRSRGRDHGEREGGVEDRGRDGQRERERDASWRSEKALHREEDRVLDSRERKLSKTERKRRRSDPEAIETERGSFADATRRGTDHEDELDRDHRPRKKKSKKEKRDRREQRHEESRYGSGGRAGSEEQDLVSGHKRSRDFGRGDSFDRSQQRDDGPPGSRRARSRDAHGGRRETPRRDSEKYRPSSESDLHGAAAAAAVGPTERKDVPRQGSGTLTVPGREDRRATASSRDPARNGSTTASPSRRSLDRGSKGANSGGGGSGVSGSGREKTAGTGRDSRDRYSSAASPRAGNVGTGASAALPGMDVYGSGTSPPSDADLRISRSRQDSRGRAGSEDVDRHSKRRRRDSRSSHRGSDLHGPATNNEDLLESRRRREGERDGSRHHHRTGSSPVRHGGLAALSGYGPIKDSEDRGGRGAERSERRVSSRSRERGRDSGRRRDAERHSSLSNLRGSGRSADRPPPVVRDGPARWRPSSPHGSYDSRDADWRRPGIHGHTASGGGRYASNQGVSLGALSIGMPPYDHMGMVGGGPPPLGMHPVGGDSGRDRHNNLAEREEREDRRRRAERAEREERRRRAEDDRWRGGDRKDGGRRADSRGSSRRSPPRSTPVASVEPPPEEEPEEGELVIDTKSSPATSSVASKLAGPLSSPRVARSMNVPDSSPPPGAAAQTKGEQQPRRSDSRSAEGKAGFRPSREGEDVRKNTREEPSAGKGHGKGWGDGVGAEEGELGATSPKTESTASGAKDADGVTQGTESTPVVKIAGHTRESKAPADSKMRRAENASEDDSECATNSSASNGPRPAAVSVSKKATVSESAPPSHAEPSTSSVNAEAKKGRGGESKARIDAGTTEKQARAGSFSRYHDSKAIKTQDESWLATNSSTEASQPQQARNEVTNGAENQATLGGKKAGDAVGAVPTVNQDGPEAKGPTTQGLPEGNGVARSETVESTRSLGGDVPSVSQSASKSGKPSGSEEQARGRESAVGLKEGAVDMAVKESEAQKPGGDGHRVQKPREVNATDVLDKGSDKEEIDKGDNRGAKADDKTASPSSPSPQSIAERATSGDRADLMPFVRKTSHSKVEDPACTTRTDAGAAAGESSATASPRITAPRPQSSPVSDNGAGSGTPPTSKSPHGSVFARLGPPPAQRTSNSGATPDDTGKGRSGDSSGITTWGPHRDRVANADKPVRPGGLIGRAFQDRLKAPRRSGTGEKGGSSSGDGGSAGTGDKQ